MAENVGERAVLRDRAAEDVVGVGGDVCSTGVKVTCEVAVVVVAGDIDRAIHRQVEQPADTARTLECAGEVLAPIVVDRRDRAIGVGDALRDEIPVVVEERVRGGRCDLLNTAASSVVGIRHEQNAIGGNGG